MSIPTDQTHKQAINVVFLTDQKYANLTAVAIRSLVAEFEKSSSSREYALSIFVICIDVIKEGKDDLIRAALADSDTSEISITLADHALEGNPQGKLRWKLLVSLKLHLTDIFPNLKKAIFLDSDIVVVDDISKLWQIDLEGHWMGVVPCLFDNPACLKNYNIAKIKFKNAADPINAGVLVFDLELMRKLNVTAKLAEWQCLNMNKLRLPEQEAISVNYPQQWKVLSHAWNFRPFGETYWTSSSWNEYKNYIGIRPSIVHFQANTRPFDLNVRLPFYEHWKRHYLHVNPDGVLNRKQLGYFQFVFFEYPDVFCRVSNFLPGGILRLILMTALVGVVVFPHAILRFLQYRKKPEEYELRITSRLSQPAIDDRVLKDRQAIQVVQQS